MMAHQDLDSCEKVDFKMGIALLVLIVLIVQCKINNKNQLLTSL